MFDSETKKSPDSVNYKQFRQQVVPLQAHNCTIIICVSFLHILANAFLDCALLSRFRVGQLLCLHQQFFFFYLFIFLMHLFIENSGHTSIILCSGNRGFLCGWIDRHVEANVYISQLFGEQFGSSNYVKVVIDIYFNEVLI